MKFLAASTTLAMLISSTAYAGGIERSRMNDLILFEDGNYAELGFTYIRPTVSGNYPTSFAGIPLGGGSTDNMSESQTLFSFGYKQQLTDEIAVALTLGQPYAADANYTAGLYNDLSASWEGFETRLLASYTLPSNFSIYGGLRILQSQAEIAIPTTLANLASGGSTTTPGAISTAYSAEGSKETDFGYVIGAAYERPEIALRVALTYESRIDVNVDTTETFNNSSVETETKINVPQAVTLDFQSGVAENTLVFGSVRWVEWSDFVVRSPAYAARTGNAAFVEFDDNTITYRLGVAQRVSDSLALIARAGYEKENGGIASRLAPTDGFLSVGVGARYTIDNISITGGLDYARFGDAEDSVGVEFDNNHVLGAGLTIGYTF